MSVKFSIIIPIFGVESYLRECLDSIIAQTFHDFEAILVDDGSKDNCPYICDDYASNDNRFKVIHKTNGGLVSARQAGLEIASGDYVVCVDGDDWISPNYLRNFASIIEEFYPDVLVCDSIYAYPDKYIETHSSLRTGFYNKSNLEKEVYPYLIYGNNRKKGFPAQLWAKAFKREIYQQQQQLVNVVVNMGEDRACVIPIIFHSNSMYVLEESCDYFYRQVPTSMTKTRKPLRVDGPKLIYQHLAKHLNLKKFNLENQLYQSTCHSLFNVCKSQFYNSTGYIETRKRVSVILNDSIYDECIKKARFRGSVLRIFMHLSLKYKMYFLMYLYSKL